MRGLEIDRWLPARRGADAVAVSKRLVWLVPPGVFLAARSVDQHQVPTLLGLLAGLWLLVWAARRPGSAAIVLLAGLPFQLFVLSYLYAHGLPSGLARAMGGWKEVLTGGIALAGIHAVATTGRRLDALDKLALAFIGTVAAIYLLPGLFDPGVRAVPQARLLAARELALFAVLFLGLRHVSLPSSTPRRATSAMLIAGVVAAALGIVEFAFSAGWNDFVVRVVGVSRFQTEVLGVQLVSPFDRRIYGSIAGREHVRAGSVWLGHSGLAFHMVILSGYVLHRMVAASARGGLQAAGALLAAALVLTATRSAVLALLVMVLVAMGRRAGGTSRGRVRAGFALLAALVLAFPTLAGSTIGDRTAGAVSGEDPSTEDHWRGLDEGIASILERPLGNGLGTGGGEGDRFGSGATVVTENAYLEVGTEAGVPVMVLFILLLLVAIRALGRRSDDGGVGAEVAPWVRLSAIGLAVAGLLLPVFGLQTSTLLWGLMGIALNRTGDGVKSLAYSAAPSLVRFS